MRGWAGIDLAVAGLAEHTVEDDEVIARVDVEGRAELIYWGVGCEKLMYGSDWPLMAIPPYIEFAKGCGFLLEAEKRMILYDNAKRLYWRD